MTAINACIFDLDGVIVETNHYHFLAWKRLAEELEIPFSEKDNEQLKGVSRKDSLDRILELGKKSLDEDAKVEMMARKNKWYVEYLKDMQPTDALPGVVNFIKSLRSNGIKTALASSSKNAKTIIAKLNLNDQFEVLKDGTDVTEAKPDPAIFLQAATSVNESPNNCVVFEDAIAGVEAARRAGMRCVGIGQRETLKNAHHVMASFEEIDLEKFKNLFR